MGKKSNPLAEVTDEQIVIEWHRRHKAGVIAFKSGDRLAPGHYIFLGEDKKAVHTLARGILQVAESEFEQVLEAESVVTEFAIDGEDDDEDETGIL